MKEFELINKFLAKRAGKRKDVICGIGDDSALLRFPPNYDVAVSTDSFVFGIHFPKNTSPYDIGYKSLAINLSDLAAMGAEPAWATLAITLPEANESWIKQFCDGFFSLLKQYNMQLIGGDTTRGPVLSITANVFGFIPKNKALYRSGAKTGDLVYVTGTLGDAGAALKLPDKHFLKKLNHPIPRIKEGLALRNIATAAIDISDGLAADLGHILEQSKIGATIYIDNLPLSTKLVKVMGKKMAQKLALSAGDDYELCFTVSPKNRPRLKAIANKFSITYVGNIEQHTGLRIQDQRGNPFALKQTGYEHSWNQI
jgi:thiamine-monophosphate kinase